MMIFPARWSPRPKTLMPCFVAASTRLFNEVGERRIVMGGRFQQGRDVAAVQRDGGPFRTGSRNENPYLGSFAEGPAAPNALTRGCEEDDRSAERTCRNPHVASFDPSTAGAPLLCPLDLLARASATEECSKRSRRGRISFLFARLGGGPAVEHVRTEGNQPVGSGEAQVPFAIGPAGRQPEQVFVAPQGRIMVVGARGVSGARNDVLGIEEQRPDLAPTRGGVGGQPCISGRVGVGAGDLAAARGGVRGI